MHLARTAVSPLVTARDRAGSFYWASDPRWFGELDAKSEYGFRDVTVVPEGTYLSVRGGVIASVETERHFGPAPASATPRRVAPPIDKILSMPRPIVGHPSRAALELMLDDAGFGELDYYDWMGQHLSDWNDLEDYRERRRVSLVAANLGLNAGPLDDTR